MILKHKNSKFINFVYGPLCFGLLLFACVTSFSAAAQKIPAAGSKSGEKAEIILPISEKDDYKVEAKGSKLVISFNKTFDGNLGKASKNLKDFVISQDAVSYTHLRAHETSV